MRKNNLKILLIAPRSLLSDKEIYTYTYPLGISYISAVLKKANFDVSCLNMNHCGGPASEIIKAELDKKKYDIVATGHTGMGYIMVDEIFKAARKHISKPKTILGGPIITSEPDLIFESLKPDFGVLGEGEDTILELLDYIEKKKDLKKVNGIMFKEQNGKTIITPKRKLIEDINKIPFPDLKGFEFEKRLSKLHSNSDYIGSFFDYPRFYPILGSRGCPFQCTFCYHSIGSQYRERTIKNIMEEIKFAIENYKVTAVHLYDDLFCLKKERIYEFCKEIKKLSKELNQKIIWDCQLMVSHVDRETLKIMKDANCMCVSYGFESYSEEVLRSMKKPITLQQMDSALKMTLDEKMGIQGNFIFGDVAETKETAKKTIDYWKKNCKGQITLTSIQPYPGSEIYKHCLKKGIIKDKLNFIKTQLPDRDIFNMTNNMTEKEFSELKNTLIKLMGTVKNEAKLLHLKKIEKNLYEILLKCPFCNEKNLYKNFYLKTRSFYNEAVMCRNCKKKIYVFSPLYKLLIKSNLLGTLVPIYHKLIKRKKRVRWKD